jgi:CheY-like chemotaxis protein
MSCGLLVVDDEPDAFELFRQSFRREISAGEYDIRFAASGEEALRMLAADAADQGIPVLLDINMPGMNGLDLLCEVRKRWPHVPVIMVTAYGDAANRRQALDNGASDFVTKPVDFRELKSTLQRYRVAKGT